MKLSCCLTFVLSFEMSSALFFGNWGYGGNGGGYGYSANYGYSSGITYQLYTQRNPVNGQQLSIGNRNSVGYSNYDSSKPTR